MVVAAQREADTRFATVEELEQWVAEASDDEIVAMYEDSIMLTSERAEYGRELIEAAKARLAESAESAAFASAAASAAD